MNDQMSDELKELAAQHHDLDARLSELTAKSHLSDSEQFEEATLKKRKLQLKDRMETLRRSSH
jgi:hypothetical protein